MNLNEFAAWFALQAEADNSRAVAERALEACGHAIDRGSLRQQSWHLLRVANREEIRADFYEALQKGFEK